MTQYYILRKDPGAEPERWHDLGVSIEAKSSYRALDIFTDGEDVKAGFYVAVSSRAWKPRPVTVKQTTTVTIG